MILSIINSIVLRNQGANYKNILRFHTVFLMKMEMIPGIRDYRHVPVNNSMFAKAEISFLIFEKNRGKCFIGQY